MAESNTKSCEPIRASSKAEVLNKAEAWAAAGISHLVLDSTSTTGDRLKAAYEVIDAFT